ncbi:hypothetical protein X728_26455 [Mesorhizobium sp. L103C120A0]|nr:hypothetical protein X728_26455 [Mesorhizobium sp. L103C120A0]
MAVKLFATVLVSDDCVEDGEELSHCGNDGDDLWIAGCDEAVPKGFEDGIVPDGNQGSHEEDCGARGFCRRR